MILHMQKITLLPFRDKRYSPIGFLVLDIKHQIRVTIMFPFQRLYCTNLSKDKNVSNNQEPVQSYQENMSEQ